MRAFNPPPGTLPRRNPLRRAGATALATLLAAAGGAAAAEGTCRSQSGTAATPLVELYTSEGCNSCPAADRWLSKLAANPGVVTLAFHVDYWDRLGWKDRFASPAFTQRQAAQRAVNGARFSYTPQVVVDGVDRTDWPGLNPAAPRPASGAAPVQLTLARDGDRERYQASVRPTAGAPRRLAAYWALTESAHVSVVKAGENDGATLHHEAVVRELLPVAEWTSRADRPAELVFQPATAADPKHGRRVNLVVVDAATGRPLQAAQLAC